jgi:hypothetical protein
MGKKGDPKKSLAAKAIVKLVLSLPDEIVKHWLSAAMIVSLLVSGGLRSSKISVDDVTHALNRNPAFSTRHAPAALDSKITVCSVGMLFHIEFSIFPLLGTYTDIGRHKMFS